MSTLRHALNDYLALRHALGLHLTPCGRTVLVDR